MPKFTRRKFVHLSSLAALSGAVPRSVRADPAAGRAVQMAQILRSDPERARGLALQAVDVARAAGATYADVRLTVSVGNVGAGSERGTWPSETHEAAIGVRAFVDGYWGFASGPYWTSDEVARLSREAVLQARINAAGLPRVAEMPPLPPMARGRWKTPVEIDPFSVSLEEMYDFMGGIAEKGNWRGRAVRERMNLATVTVGAWFRFEKVEKTFASSDGIDVHQTLIRSSGWCGLKLREREFGLPPRGAVSELPSGGYGWELMKSVDWNSEIERLYEQALADVPPTQVLPVDVGRYDAVFSADAMAALVYGTIGRATMLDRALGFEANAEGTSYLGPNPLELLGSFQVGAPIVTVTANRSMPHAYATVKWDDEGAEPDDFTLVKDGVLMDYQTTREQVQWLAPWYTKLGMPMRSHGCANADSALDVPIQHPPNLVLEPGKEEIGFHDLIRGVKKGIAVDRVGGVFVDQQARNGVVVGRVREIRDGKLGAILKDAGILFNSVEIWKNIIALGGPASVFDRMGRRDKGEPSQVAWTTVRAVPGAVRDVTVIDLKRKA